VQKRQFRAKEIFIPSGVKRQPVVGDDKRASLRFGQMPEHDHGHLLHAELLRRKDSRMAREDFMIGSGQNGVVHPNSRIDAAICAICELLCVRGLLTRGMSRSIGRRSIRMPMFAGTVCAAFAMLSQ
jgi:hypothetical protein